MIEAGNFLEKAELNLAHEKLQESARGVDWTIESILKDHFVGAEIPANEFIWIYDVFSVECQLIISIAATSVQPFIRRNLGIWIKLKTIITFAPI